MFVCKKCNKSGRSAGIQCGVCDGPFHTKCVGIDAEELKDYSRGNGAFWKCPKCRNMSRTSIISADKDVDTVNVASLHLPTHADISGEMSSELAQGVPSSSEFTQSILAELRYLRSIKTNIQAIEISIQACFTQMEEINARFITQNELIAGCVSKIESLETANTKINKENEELKLRVNQLEQNFKTNSIEITGIPECKNENIYSIVQTLGTAVHCNIDEASIDSTFRAKLNPNKPNDPRPIVVNFLRNSDKVKFLKCKKVIRDLKVSHLNKEIFSGTNTSDNFIYINENLTQANRKLLAQAREFRKKNNIKYVWTNNGRIFMRFNDNSKVFLITSTNDFKDVH